MPESSSPFATTKPPSDESADANSRFELRVRVRDIIAFSSALPAVIAAALSLAASHALGATDITRSAVLAASGTFVVYGLDRLRDLPRDRVNSPKRTHFVESHSRAISLAVGCAGVILAAALLTAPIPVVTLCLGVGAIGLLHRRLKGSDPLKSIYVSLSWVCVCVAIPAITHWNGPRFAWVAAVFLAAIGANLLASNSVDTLPGRGQRPRDSILACARVLAGVGVLIAWLAPPPLMPLGWIPLAEAFALAFFRPDEYFEHLAVDGALLVGALGYLLHTALS